MRARRFPKAWYAIAVRPGSENTVRKRLRKQVRIDMIDKVVGRVLVPTQKILTINEKRQRRIRRPKKFPGYVLIECHYCPTVYKLVRECRGTFGFLPLGDKPQTIPFNQIDPLLAAEKAKRKRASITEVHIPYEVGEEVKIVDGGFRDVIGTVVDIDEPSPNAMPVVRVRITLLGRPHHIDLQYWQVRQL